MTPSRPATAAYAITSTSAFRRAQTERLTHAPVLNERVRP